MRTTSWLTAVGLVFMFVGVGTGVGSGELGMILGLAGVLVGVNFIAVGVLVGGNGEEPAAPIGRAPCALLGAFMAFLRRNIDVVGLILSSSALTAVAGGEAGPVLCSAMFALFLLGLCFINIHVLGEE